MSVGLSWLYQGTLSCCSSKDIEVVVERRSSWFCEQAEVQLWDAALDHSSQMRDAASSEHPRSWRREIDLRCDCASTLSMKMRPAIQGSMKGGPEDISYG